MVYYLQCFSHVAKYNLQCFEIKIIKLNKVIDGKSSALDNINWSNVPVCLLEFCTCSFATNTVTPGASMNHPA